MLWQIYEFCFRKNSVLFLYGCKVVLVLVFGFLLFVFVMLLFMLGSCG